MVFPQKKSGGRKVEGNLSPSTPNMLKNSEVEGVEGKIDINMKRAFQSRKALFNLFEISKLLIQSLSNVNSTSSCTTYHRVVTDTQGNPSYNRDHKSLYFCVGYYVVGNGGFFCLWWLNV